MAQGDIFGGDPFTGAGSFESNTGNLPDVSIDKVFNGRFTVNNGFFRDTTDPSKIIGLGQQGGFTLQDVGNGRFSLSTQIDPSRVNRINNEMAWRTVTGTVDILLSDGSIETLGFGPQEVTRAGYQAIAYPRQDGPPGIAFVRGIYNTNAEVQAVFGINYRLATPTETVQAAVSKRIYEDNQDALNRIGEDKGIINDNGFVNLSGTVRFIMTQVNMSNVDVFTQYLFE